MDIRGCSREDNQVISYLNESFRMIYHNEQNENKIFWWWLNKFEYLAYLTEVPDDKMTELFIKMVHENIHERVKTKYPAINFPELSYEEIINHYISFFSYNQEILSQRKPFKHRNDYEQKAIEKFADNLQGIYNNGTYKYELEKKIARTYLYKFNNMELTKYLKEMPPQSLRHTEAIKFAKAIELARYINPAISMIKIYKSTNRGKFHEWLDKFEYVANISKVPDDKMLECFYNMVDNDVHSAVKMTYPSISLTELPYEETINVYLQYFAPSDDSDLHKKRLLCRKQYKKETIENYANSLQKLSTKCIYTSQLNEILRKQFLNGMRDNEIRTLLNKFPKFLFNDMVELAIELTKSKQITSYLQTTHSRIKTFHPMNGEEFYEWLNEFEYVADIIRLPGDETVKFFKDMVHNDVHHHVHKCNPFVIISELSYEKIVNHYLSYLYISKAFYLHRKRFMCRKQYEHETLQHFADSLWKIQFDCKYTDRLDERLREQFRNEIHDDKIKSYIDNYPNLSFELMVAIAIAYSNELILMENECCTDTITIDE